MKVISYLAIPAIVLVFAVHIEATHITFLNKTGQTVVVKTYCDHCGEDGDCTTITPGGLATINRSAPGKSFHTMVYGLRKVNAQCRPTGNQISMWCDNNFTGDLYVLFPSKNPDGTCSGGFFMNDTGNSQDGPRNGQFINDPDSSSCS